MAAFEDCRTLWTREAFLLRPRGGWRGRGCLGLSVHFGPVAGEDIGAAEQLITDGALVPFRLVGGEVPPEAADVLKGFIAVRAVVTLRHWISLKRSVDALAGHDDAVLLLGTPGRTLRWQSEVGRHNLLHVLQLVLLAPKEDALPEAAEALVVAVEVDEYGGHDRMIRRRGRR